MRIGTLFSGIGAPEQGAKRVYDDLELVFACEFDKFARKSFQANYDICPYRFHKDVNDMDGKQYNGHVDIIIGGSPCQDFSIAGLRAGIDGHRGQLIWQYYRIIMEAQPEIFIYENVKGMVSDKGGKTLNDFLQIFRESGYYCHHAVLNTKDYGVPQNRERIYIVGFKDHELYHRFEFAEKTDLKTTLQDIFGFNFMFIEQKGRGFNEGGFFYDICPSITSNAWHENHIAFSVVTGGKKPTPRECLRLQDFPDTFEQVVSNSQQYKQAGNSMSVNILEMIFNQIEKAKAQEPTNTLMDFLHD